MSRVLAEACECYHFREPRDECRGPRLKCWAEIQCENTQNIQYTVPKTLLLFVYEKLKKRVNVENLYKKNS